MLEPCLCSQTCSHRPLPLKAPTKITTNTAESKAPPLCIQFQGQLPTLLSPGLSSQTLVHGPGQAGPPLLTHTTSTAVTAEDKEGPGNLPWKYRAGQRQDQTSGLSVCPGDSTLTSPGVATHRKNLRSSRRHPDQDLQGTVEESCGGSQHRALSPPNTSPSSLAASLCDIEPVLSPVPGSPVS